MTKVSKPKMNPQLRKNAVSRSVTKHICKKGKVISFIKLLGGQNAKEVQCVDCGRIHLI